jgi:hypothetical protein
MKLHHTAESKGQGRGSGAYDLEGAPAKGGPTGCFVGETQVLCHDPITGFPARPTIRDLVADRAEVRVATVDPARHFGRLVKPVTDWFCYEVPAADLVRLTLASGEVVDGTRNHEFVLADGTRKPAGALRVGDDLMEV